MKKRKILVRVVALLCALLMLGTVLAVVLTSR